MFSKAVLALGALLAACALSSEAVDKSKAIGPCVNGWCPPNSYCVEQECYPNEPKFYSPTRRFGNASRKSENAVGPCVNGRCPNGYACTNDECVPSISAGSGKNGTSIGPCINNLCPKGFTCNMEEYKCYP